MNTIRDLLEEARNLDSDTARLDAEVLLASVLEQSRSYLYTWPERQLPALACEKYRQLLARRRKGEPVAYLVGRREFWSLDLKIESNTLIPRPETELLVEWTLGLGLREDGAVLDLGTGSGAIALALASERRDWQVMAADASPGAVACARRNALRLGLNKVGFLVSDWFEALAGHSFDVIVSNPPYLGAADPHLKCGDLRFEPRSALVAGDDGLADLNKITQGARSHLCEGGWLLMEHGAEQGGQVRSLLEQLGYQQVETRRDMAGLDRASGGRWPGQETQNE